MHMYGYGGPRYASETVRPRAAELNRIPCQQGPRGLNFKPWPTNSACAAGAPSLPRFAIAPILKLRVPNLEVLVALTSCSKVYTYDRHTRRCQCKWIII